MKQRKFDPIFTPEPYKFLSTNEHMIIVENCQNGTILKQHRDNVKHLPRTISNKINNEKNHINDKYRYCLYVLIMSHMRFRVNLPSVVA